MNELIKATIVMAGCLFVVGFYGRMSLGRWLRGLVLGLTINIAASCAPSPAPLPALDDEPHHGTEQFEAQPVELER